MEESGGEAVGGGIVVAQLSVQDQSNLMNTGSLALHCRQPPSEGMWGEGRREEKGRRHAVCANLGFLVPLRVMCVGGMLRHLNV